MVRTEIFVSLRCILLKRFGLGNLETPSEICDYVTSNLELCESGEYLLWTTYVLCADSVGIRVNSSVVLNIAGSFCHSFNTMDDPSLSCHIHCG